MIVKADGIDDRDDADRLRGMELFVPRSALPEPDEDEFYYQDLEGMIALDADGRRIGIVKQVMNHGAGDLLEITADKGGSLIFPFDKETVPKVDLETRELTVTPRSEVGCAKRASPVRTGGGKSMSGTTEDLAFAENSSSGEGSPRPGPGLGGPYAHHLSGDAARPAGLFLGRPGTCPEHMVA